MIPTCSGNSNPDLRQYRNEAGGGKGHRCRLASLGTPPRCRLCGRIGCPNPGPPIGEEETVLCSLVFLFVFLVISEGRENAASPLVYWL